MRLSFFLYISFIFLFACARKVVSNTTTDKTNINDFSISRIIQDVNKQSLNAKLIQARGQVSLDDGGFFSSGSLNLRLVHDSIIWFSISKLGLEIARGLVTRDSAYAINNWENSYWKGSLLDVSTKYKVPADFTDIESILIPSLNPTAEYLVAENANTTGLQQQGKLNKKYTINFQNMTISSVMISYSDSDFKVNYQEYTKQGNYHYPFTHTHLLKNGNEIHETKIKFSSINQVEKLNTPFHIPGDYELIK